MKGLKNNGGYTLTELLLTLFIFSVVMLGITMIMRTTSISYSDGNAEVSMQTEAQIIANQIEELLVDATSYNGLQSIEGGSQYYSFVSAGVTHYIKHDAEEDRIYYQSGSLDDTNGWKLMADYVEDFSIGGYTSDETSSNCDNRVTVRIDMNKRDYTYSTVKDVYFRNAIENTSVYEIDAGAIPESGDPSEYTATIVLDRYAIIDLEKEYNLNPDAGITVSDGFYGKYIFANVEYATGNEDMKDRYSVHSVSLADDGGHRPTQFISTNTTLNNIISEEVTASNGITIQGTSHTGAPLKFLITTPAVHFNVEEGGGVVIMGTSSNDTGARDNMIQVDGIDFCAMVEYPIDGSHQMDYAMVVYGDNDNNQMYTYGGSNQGINGNTMTPAKGSTLNAAGTTGVIGNQIPYFQTNLGIRIDATTGDLSVIQGNPAANNASGLSIGQNLVRVAFLLKFPGADGSAGRSYQVVDLALYTQGNDSGAKDLTDCAGGNTYSSSSSWGVTW